MLKKANIGRLALAERVLDNFEDMIKLGATPVENLRLIENELQFLEQVREEDPERIGNLIERFSAVRAGLARTIQ